MEDVAEEDGSPGGFDVGELLRRARRLARLSQRDLAARAGVPPATVSRLESGATTNPQLRTLEALFGAAGARLTVLSGAGRELPEHPWEFERDDGMRHFPAHLDLFRVNEPYDWQGHADWWGWYRAWAWRPGVRIPVMTFYRYRTAYYCPPLDVVTGEPARGPRTTAPGADR